MKHTAKAIKKITIKVSLITAICFLFTANNANAQCDATNNSWCILGNSGTTATNYVGTIDPVPLIFKTTETEWMRISPTGNVGIFTIAPAYKLDVSGDINLTGALRIATAAGTTGQVLTSAGGGANTWTTPTTGTVTSIVAGTGLTGGTISTSGTIALSIPVSIANGGTNNTTIGAAGSVLYSNGTQQTSTLAGISGQVLTSTGAGMPAWTTTTAGTVTSIVTNNGIAGGVITSTGTLGLTGQALALHNLATNGLIVRTGVGIIASRTLTGSARINIINGDGVSGNPTIDIAQNAATTGQVLKWNGTAWVPSDDNNSNISGNGSLNFLARWTSHHTLTTGTTFDNGAKVGIGTTAPKQTLDVNGRINITRGVIQKGGAAITNTTDLGLYSLDPYTWMRFVTNKQPIRFYSDGGIGTTANMIIAANGEVGIGTDLASNTDHYKLAVNGAVRAKRFVVETTWQDFVFDKKYKLKSLQEVEQYIKQNGHLPEIPSAKEVESNGGDLGELVSLQMKKIEELTLYVIEQNKKIEELSKQIKSLKQ